jgi:hypothetical protein
MRNLLILSLALILLTIGVSGAYEAKKYQLSEAFGLEAAEECYLQYYYYVPCPTESWFWGFYQWEQNDIIGQYFVIGDNSTGIYEPCDPQECHTLQRFRVLDFAGYGTIYPGQFTVEFDVWCSDADGCPVGPALWNSGPVETEHNWGFIDIVPPIFVTPCAIDPGPPAEYPRILITARHVGTDPIYPRWGTDNISAPVNDACEMHDIGCLAALYPRPASSHYTTIHSGYYGIDFEYCPPQWFADGEDTTAEATTYGYVEFAWRLYILCEGAGAVEPSTWGAIKSMYNN